MCRPTGPFHQTKSTNASTLRDGRHLRRRGRDSVRQADAAEAAARSASDPLEAWSLRDLADRLYGLSAIAGPRPWTLR